MCTYLIERIKEVAQVNGDALLRENPITCLCGFALQWDAAELTDDAQNHVKLGTGGENWAIELLKQFNDNPKHATDLRKITQFNLYTLSDDEQSQKDQ